MNFKSTSSYPLESRKILQFIYRLSFLSFLTVVLPLNISRAQLNQVNLEHILSDKGLSQNTIHAIFQDKEGFLWFATEDGLDKYDGYNFTVYKNNPQNKSSISDNFIWTLFEDKKGVMWVGTNSGGLSKYNRSTESFINYRHNPKDPGSISNNNVRAICESSDGIFWIGTEGGGLNEFDSKTGKFTRYAHQPGNPQSLSNNIVLTVFQDKDGTIWVGSDGGLDRLDSRTKTFKHYSSDPNNPNSISNNVVLTIYQDREGYFWIGTLNGLNRFDKKTGIFTRYQVDNRNSGNSNRSRINSILEDKQGTFWIGTGGGLYQFNRDSGKFINIKYVSQHFTSLTSNNVLALYEDNSGLIWIGTAEGGVEKFDRERMKFVHYAHDPADPSSLSYNTIRSIYQDANGTLWIGTLGGGLNVLDRSRKKFICFRHNPENSGSISENSVSSIYRDRSGTLWVGTWGGGLNKMVLKGGTGNWGSAVFEHYIHSNSDPQSLSNNIIQSIYEDSNGRLWIGTGQGLDLMDRSSGKFTSFINNPDDSTSISDNQVQSCIHEDRKGNLWVGTWDGLNKLVVKNRGGRGIPDKFEFIRYKHSADNPFSLSDNRVISVFEDGAGNLWFGTYGGGLNKLPVDEQGNRDPGHVHFMNYSMKDGLASNIIYGILGDNTGNIWLSTDNGLTKFNPEKLSIRNYYESDGLQGNQFFWGASFKGAHDELFFGGTNGVNAFFPGSLRDNKHVPPIVITDFQIFNRPVPISGGNSPLTKSITETKSITLSYSQNVFSFEFSALDYTAPNKNQYQYMMKGFDKNWINAGSRRYVTYTNLDPGEYVFMVRGSNNDGIWNEKGASLKITILPPFWGTWWFILLSILLGGSIIVLIVSSRVRHLLEIERFRTKLAADLHDNIGSSLTEISILSEVISTRLNSAGEDVKKSLKMISDNSRNLIDNMSDIVWLVNPKRDSLYDLILRLRDTYTELSSYTSISFRSENLKSLEKVSLSMEHRQHLYLIFKEGINNCITHSGCTEISLDAFVKGKRLEMILKDNGKGFDIKDEFSGNGLSNMKRRAEAIGGVIMIDSKPNEGTTLQFVGNIT